MSISEAPSNVNLKDGSIVPLDTVEVGQTVCFCVGESITVDGIISKGKALIDESSLTGESMPIDRRINDQVYSGTLIQNGYIEVKLTSIPKDTVASQIKQMVENAQMSSSNTEQIIEKFAKIYTPLVISISVLTGLIPFLLGYPY